MNNHYVPCFILKNFGGGKLSFYDTKKKELFKNRNVHSSFCTNNIYSDKIEIELNHKIEAHFSILLNNKILASTDTLTFNKSEINLIKKFLLISTLRTVEDEKLLSLEKNYYQIEKQNWLNLGLTDKEWNEKHIMPPFKETSIDNETDEQYWLRTIQTILDSEKCTGEEISKMKNATYSAYRWANTFNSGFLGFWDSEFTHEEFLITDAGMTSETDKGVALVSPLILKQKYLIDLYNQYKNINPNLSKQILHELNNTIIMHENFMMFPISSQRIIVLINPFFKFLEQLEKYKVKVLPISSFTYLDREKLFKPNKVNYVEMQIDPKTHNFDENDKYIYKINRLSNKETKYINELFLDRITNFVGFSNLDKVKGSIIKYYEEPNSKRVDYGELIKIIKEDVK